MSNDSKKISEHHKNDRRQLNMVNLSIIELLTRYLNLIFPFKVIKPVRCHFPTHGFKWNFKWFGIW